MSGVKELVQEAAQAVMKKAVALAPDRWIPGGTPDPLATRTQGWVGAPVSRVDGPLKVQGLARFAAEVPLDGLLHAALVFAPVARGRIATLDTRAAEAAPGVELVMTHRNAPPMKPAPYFMQQPLALAGDNLPVMQDDRIHWNGQPIALVLAGTLEQAEHAASLVRVTCAAEPARTTFDAARASDLETGVFMGEPLEARSGDAEAALASAPVRVDEVYRTPRQNHNAMEPHAVTLAWRGDELMLHDTTQAVTHTAWTLGHVFGIDQARVHVSSPFVGGGFGGKCLWQHQILAAAAARLVQRPVRLALSREGVYRVVGGRALTEQRVAIGAREDGGFEVLIHTGATAMTDNNNLPEPFINPTLCLYAAGTLALGVKVTRMDTLANTFMRAPGEAVGSFALESAIDELADRLGMDPIALRLCNEPQKDPVNGLPFSARHLREAWERGAGRFGWDERRPAPRSRREGEWLVGMGAAAATYPYFRMPGGAARITLTRDGRATVSVAAHEMGMGTATVQAQVAAERLGLPLERVRVVYGDSTLPGQVLAGGSQQTASIGAAVIAAHHALVQELLAGVDDASPLAGLKAETVGSRDGGLCALDDPARHERYEQLLDRLGREEVSVEGSAPQPLELQHWSMHSYGAIFCELRVSALTGETRVARLLGSFDCGRIINPKTATSQFRGGMIMGLGSALMEETLFDERSGRIMNPSLAQYHVPVHLDVPDIDVIWTDIPDPHTPMGARGIGEIGITGVAAAVANAAYNATGKRVRDLPITLDKLL